MKHLSIVITDECFARLKAGTPETVDHGDLIVHMSYLPPGAVKALQSAPEPTGSGNPVRLRGDGFYVLSEREEWTQE